MQVPSRVLQAPPLRHWHVKLQPKPHVPLGQLMEQSTPCQPAMTRVPGHVNKQRQHGQPLPATLPFRNILEVGSRAPALVQGAWLCRVKPFSELNQRSSTAAKREAPLGYWGKRDQVGRPLPVQGQGEGRLGWWSEGEGQRLASGPFAGPHSTELGQTGQHILS